METQKKFKMKSFKVLNRRFILIGVWRADSSTNERKLCFIKNCVFYSTLMSFFVTTVWFAIFSAQSIREITESSYFALFSLLCIAWYSALVWQRDSYAAISNELETKNEQRMSDPLVMSIYRNTNRKIEFITKTLFLMIHILGVIYSLFPIALSIFKYVTLGYSDEIFVPIYPATYPFDQNTPAGYFVCLLIQIPSMLVEIECYVSPLMLTIGFCLFIADFACDLRVKLLQINDELIKFQGNKLTATKRIWLKIKLIEFIKFHTDAREFALRFSNLNQSIMFVCPVFTIVVFGGLIIRSKTILESGDIIGIVQTIEVTYASLLPFFLFCHFGGNVMHRFENLGNDLYQIEWYKLPMEMQKQLPIIICSTHKRIYMRGYGDSRTTHSVFKKILKNKFYYFMLARKI